MSEPSPAAKEEAKALSASAKKAKDLVVELVGSKDIVEMRRLEAAKKLEMTID